MNEYGERSFRPEILNVGFCGQLGDKISPCMLINSRRIPQNIALACYEHPMSLGDLSSELGIGRPYLEDEVAALERSELLAKVSKDCYRTNFVIPDAELVAEQISMQAQAATEILPAVRSFFQEHQEKIGVAGVSEEFPYGFALWTLTPYALRDPELLGTKPPLDDLPLRSDGGRWVVMANNQSPEQRAIYSERPFLGINGPMVSNDGHGMVWALETQWTGFSTVRDWLVMRGRRSCHVIDHLIERDMRLDRVDDGYRERVSELIERGILESREGRAVCRVLWLGREQMEQLREILDCLREELASSALHSTIAKIEARYRDRTPAHLHDQVASVVAASAYTVAMFVVNGLVEDGFLPEPTKDEKDRICILMQGTNPGPK